MTETFTMDPNFFAKFGDQAKVEREQQQSTSNYRKNQVKLDEKHTFYGKLIYIPAKPGIPRNTPFIRNWMHRIPVGEENGKTKYDFVVCPRTEMGVRGSGKACKFCGHNSKLYNDEQAGDQIAKAQREQLKARFYGFAAIYIVQVKDRVTKQVVEHADTGKVRILPLSKVNWEDELQPKLEGVDGDEMTAIGYPAIFGNPGRLLVITADKDKWGLTTKISVSEQAIKIETPADFETQIAEVDFDSNYKKSDYAAIEAAFEKYVVNGGMKIPGTSVTAATVAAPVVTGGLAGALATGLSAPAAPMTTIAAPAAPIQALETPSSAPAPAIDLTEAAPATTAAAAPGSLAARVQARKAKGTV